jgi:uncharacterized protein
VPRQPKLPSYAAIKLGAHNATKARRTVNLKEKKFRRIFYATDIHGSERCFRKFLNATKFYHADDLILGGDVTGKIVIPIVDLGDGTFKADYVGREEIARSAEQVKRLEQLIADSGYYYYHVDKSAMDHKPSAEEINELFVKAMKETLGRWIEYAEQFLRDTETVCYITGGNDDLQEVIDGIHDGEHVKNPDNKVVKIDETHEMASMGYGNQTPWKCPRDISEKELGERIENVMASVSDPANCILNFHVPPVNCGLDTVAKLDGSVYPPKPITEGGLPVLFGAGSESVRNTIMKYQPLLDLCGHIHESRGTTKIGKTLVINPGSEYSEGILRGTIVNISDKKVLSWQLTSG